jgi:hypothetical protein
LFGARQVSHYRIHPNFDSSAPSKVSHLAATKYHRLLQHLLLAQWMVVLESLLIPLGLEYPQHFQGLNREY